MIKIFRIYSISFFRGFGFFVSLLGLLSSQKVAARAEGSAERRHSERSRKASGASCSPKEKKKSEEKIVAAGARDNFVWGGASCFLGFRGAPLARIIKILLQRASGASERARPIGSRSDPMSQLRADEDFSPHRPTDMCKSGVLALGQGGGSGLG